MRELVLVTHPEATHHVDGLVGGWYDADLTTRGLAQAEQVAEAVGSVGSVGQADAVFSSTLLRCRRTAEAIATRVGVEVVLDPDMREQSYGVAGGHPPGTFPFVRAVRGDDLLRHHDGVEGSETRLDVATRIYRALERIEAAGHERTVVVGHGGASSYVVTAWLGMPLESVGPVRFAFASGSITRLREKDDGERSVQSLADTAHLR
ncbi:histidine phosphatase family protein [Nocardioides rubriscoriae]|uniref:histidine phosphatase family protein n=1 Tax=Nocardioides rubriscoriae TaxID=642762 RepID=UPI0011DFF902|nr:histidine phosphatase family protein [Nocardioides rubriscoriae]